VLLSSQQHQWKHMVSMVVIATALATTTGNMMLPIATDLVDDTTVILGGTTDMMGMVTTMITVQI
jgi:hypothetical protein